MKNYILYDENGMILKTGQCTHATFKQREEAGEYILEGIANDLEYEIKDGKVVRKKSPVKLPPVKYFQPAIISQEAWEDLLKRIEKLERHR